MNESDCLFCKVVAGELPAEIIFESETVVAFRDINPKAPTHVLLIPKRHIATINDLVDGDQEIIGEMFLSVARLADDEGFADDGYRVVMNCNAAAGQTVFHIHLHLLAGRQLTWPPG